MTASEAAGAAKEAGFTHVQSFGGPIPLDEWMPYGKREGHNVVTFNLEGALIVEEAVPEPHLPVNYFILGRWPLLVVTAGEEEVVTP